MASTAPFDRLDHIYPVYRRVETPASRNQTSGVVTPRSFTNVAIFGHVSYQRGLATEKEELVRSNGLEERGQARFHTETLLKEGDEVRICHDSAGTTFTDYRVVSHVSDHPTIDKYLAFKRHTFGLERTGR